MDVQFFIRFIQWAGNFVLLHWFNRWLRFSLGWSRVSWYTHSSCETGKMPPLLELYATWARRIMRKVQQCCQVYYLIYFPSKKSSQKSASYFHKSKLEQLVDGLQLRHYEALRKTENWIFESSYAVSGRFYLYRTLNQKPRNTVWGARERMSISQRTRRSPSSD